MFKRISTCFLVLLILLAGAASASAATFTSKFFIGKKYFYINSEKKTMDTAPVIESGRTLLPIRYAAYAVNIPEANITWDEKAKKAVVKKGDSTVVFTVGSKTMDKDGTKTQMDVSPVMKSGRMLLPLRFVAKALGVNCEYVPQTKTIIISDGTIYTGVIDMEAARNGTLAPPPDAKSPPEEGFAPAFKYFETKLGSRYATVTRLDGTKYQLDLGTEVIVVCAKKEWQEELIRVFPKVYNKQNCIVDPIAINKDGHLAAPCYLPYIPTAVALGVPKENIVWDGKHLAIFGWYGDKKNYRVLTAGSREIVWYFYDIYSKKHKKGVAELNYPLYVRDGVPMLGTDTVNDFENMLFTPMGGLGILNLGKDGGFDSYTGWYGFEN